mmetsp:Transcript_13215/g.19915  ORF Transcript_13215/g.19915 Transcript_13215/m.19915 type:complete len:121 (-) Transcript_13215:173-535(-)
MQPAAADRNPARHILSKARPPHVGRGCRACQRSVGGAVTGMRIQDLGEVTLLTSKALQEECRRACKTEFPAVVFSPTQCMELLTADRIACIIVGAVGHVVHEISCAVVQAHQEEEICGNV